jgi:hypothetical protein
MKRKSFVLFMLLAALLLQSEDSMQIQKHAGRSPCHVKIVPSDCREHRIGPNGEVENAITFPVCDALPVVTRCQEDNDWCYAACAQMCMETIDPNLQFCQCDIVTKFLGMTCCKYTDARCNNAYKPGLPGCDQPGLPPFVAFNFCFDSTDYGYYLSFEEIKYQITCLHKPVTYIALDQDLTWHELVIKGYRGGRPGNQWLCIIDPYGPQVYTIAYDDYRAFNSAVWTAHAGDYFNITEERRRSTAAAARPTLGC